MRSRNIKPGFFKNEKLVELSYETRLLFIGLWCMADRDGRLDDRPKKIKMEIFPADDLNIEQMLESLHVNNFVNRYTVENRNYIQVLNFHKHQKPHNKEQASSIPEPPKPQPRSVQTTTKVGASNDQGNGEHALIPDCLIPDSLNLIANNKGVGENPKTERRQTSKSEDQLRESFQKLKPFLSQKFPLLDLEFEEEQCVAKYQNKLPCNDPDVRVMEWCKRAKPPEKQPDGSPPKTKAQQREEANIAAGQEALRMIKAAKEAKANGQGCQSHGSDNTARGCAGRTADITADYRVCGSP